MAQAAARLQLFGPVRFMVDGVDLTPKGAKAKALLALLATSPGMCRSRRWLEGKLWSDRGPEQASASLRQTVSEIRRLVAGHPHLFSVDRTNVTLAHTSAPLDPIPGAGEFLEGIDVRDEEFESWLRTMRSRCPQPEPAPIGPVSQKTRLVVGCRSGADSSSENRLVATVFADQIAGHICDQVSALRRVLTRTGDALERADIDVDCQVVRGDDRPLAFLRIIASSTGQILFSRAVEIVGSPLSLIGSMQMGTMTFEAAEAALQHIPTVAAKDNPDACASALTQTALRKMFSFEAIQLGQADSLLQQAYALSPDPRHLVWRALILTIQDIELLDRDTARLKSAAEQLIGSALTSGTENALPLAIAAIVRAMLFDDANEAEYLARTATYVNPDSAFSLKALAVAQMMLGDLSAAYANSRKSHEMSASSAYRHWWDLYHSIVCISCSAFDEALRSAEAAARRAPNFRPPLRSLIALYSYFGMDDKARTAGRRLATIEPDFSTDRFRNDPAYPNRTLRQAGLLKHVAGL